MNRGVASRAAAAVCRQRLRGAHLRSRLVSAAPARHRIVGRCRSACCSAPSWAACASAACCCRASSAADGASAARLRLRSSSASASSACCCCSAMPLVGGVYTAWAGTGVDRHPAARLVAGICLLPPTLLMGATLPAIARWVETTPDGVSWLGFFYGGNIAGAVLGSLLAGFYLLRVYDMSDRDLRRGRAQRRRRGCWRWRSPRATAAHGAGRRTRPMPRRPRARRGSAARLCRRSRCPD